METPNQGKLFDRRQFRPVSCPHRFGLRGSLLCLVSIAFPSQSFGTALDQLLDLTAKAAQAVVTLKK